MTIKRIERFICDRCGETYERDQPDLRNPAYWELPDHWALMKWVRCYPKTDSQPTLCAECYGGFYSGWRAHPNAGTVQNG